MLGLPLQLLCVCFASMHIRCLMFFLAVKKCSANYVFVLGIYFLIMILLGFPASVISLFIRSENSLFPSVLRACFYFVRFD